LIGDLGHRLEIGDDRLFWVHECLRVRCSRVSAL